MKMLRKIICSLTLTAFLATFVCPPSVGFAQIAPASMLTLTPAFHPAMVKGIKIFPDNPLRFDFIVDPGESGLEGDALKTESTKLIKYFLASVTTPAKDMWVNLSPKDKDRIIPDSFGQTLMGQELLKQDYLLKQLTASLLFPEGELGKKFWEELYAKTNQKFSSTDIPLDTFNRVWIVPDKAKVYAKGDTAYVTESHLKVLLEDEYFNSAPTQTESAQILKHIIIPAIEKEVNEGQTFANLRQIYNAMILAAWFKRNLKQSVLGQSFADQNKIQGVDSGDKQAKDKIYENYLELFKQGSYNYIKEEYDPSTQEVVTRKYISGGFDGKKIQVDEAMSSEINSADEAMSVSVNLVPENKTASSERSLPTEFTFNSQRLALRGVNDSAEKQKKYDQWFTKERDLPRYLWESPLDKKDKELITIETPDGKIQGMVLAYLGTLDPLNDQSKPTYQIDQIEVDDSYRKQGLAKLLIAKVIQKSLEDQSQDENWRGVVTLQWSDLESEKYFKGEGLGFVDLPASIFGELNSVGKIRQRELILFQTQAKKLLAGVQTQLTDSAMQSQQQFKEDFSDEGLIKGPVELKKEWAKTTSTLPAKSAKRFRFFKGLGVGIAIALSAAGGIKGYQWYNQRVAPAIEYYLKFDPYRVERQRIESYGSASEHTVLISGPHMDKESREELWKLINKQILQENPDEFKRLFDLNRFIWKHRAILTAEQESFNQMLGASLQDIVETVVIEKLTTYQPLDPRVKSAFEGFERISDVNIKNFMWAGGFKSASELTEALKLLLFGAGAHFASIPDYKAPNRNIIVVDTAEFDAAAQKQSQIIDDVLLKLSQTLSASNNQYIFDSLREYSTWYPEVDLSEQEWMIRQSREMVSEESPQVQLLVDKLINAWKQMEKDAVIAKADKIYGFLKQPGVVVGSIGNSEFRHVLKGAEKSKKYRLADKAMTAGDLNRGLDRLIQNWRLQNASYVNPVKQREELKEFMGQILDYDETKTKLDLPQIEAILKRVDQEIISSLQQTDLIEVKAYPTARAWLSYGLLKSVNQERFVRRIYNLMVIAPEQAPLVLGQIAIHQREKVDPEDLEVLPILLKRVFQELERMLNESAVSSLEAKKYYIAILNSLIFYSSRALNDEAAWTSYKSSVENVLDKIKRGGINPRVILAKARQRFKDIDADYEAFQYWGSISNYYRYFFIEGKVADASDFVSGLSGASASANDRLSFNFQPFSAFVKKAFEYLTSEYQQQPTDPIKAMDEKQGQVIRFTLPKDSEKVYRLGVQIDKSPDLYREMTNIVVEEDVEQEDGYRYPVAFIDNLTMEDGRIHQKGYSVVFDYDDLYAFLEERYERKVMGKSLYETLLIYFNYGNDNVRLSEMKKLLEFFKKYNLKTDDQLTKFFENAPKALRSQGLGHAMGEFLSSFTPVGLEKFDINDNEETLRDLKEGKKFEDTLLGKILLRQGFELNEKESKNFFIISTKTKIPQALVNWLDRSDLGEYIEFDAAMTAEKSIMEDLHVLSEQTYISPKQLGDQVAHILENLESASYQEAMKYIQENILPKMKNLNAVESYVFPNAEDWAGYNLLNRMLDYVPFASVVAEKSPASSELVLGAIAIHQRNKADDDDLEILPLFLKNTLVHLENALNSNDMEEARRCYVAVISSLLFRPEDYPNSTPFSSEMLADYRTALEKVLAQLNLSDWKDTLTKAYKAFPRESTLAPQIYRFFWRRVMLDLGPIYIFGSANMRDFVTDGVKDLEAFQNEARTTSSLAPEDDPFLSQAMKVLQELLFGVQNSVPAGNNQDLGGIDFNTDKLDLQTTGQAVEYDLPANLQGIDFNNVTGFSPVIFQMTPITNLPLFLGINETEPAQQLSAKSI